MSNKTFQKPRDYSNTTKKELAKHAISNPYTTFYECEMRFADTNEQDLELIKISIASLESILKDIDEHNIVNLLQELGKQYSEEELHQLLKDRVSELNKALDLFITGKLSIKTNPITRLYIEGKGFGLTPLEDIILPVGEVLLEFECTATGDRYSKTVEIKENVTVLINTTDNEQQKVNALIKAFNKQTEKQAFIYIPTYFSFFHTMYECEWDSELSLKKIIEQGHALSEERKKSGIRRLVHKKTEGFSNTPYDGYYNVKFWEIMRTGVEAKTQSGPVDTGSPRKNLKSYANEALAIKDFEKKIKAKLKSGFKEEN
ncbi:hypothetical protein [Olleya sp. HaHaR_3_96]|uniref:hypothetical protein n=1 Tax=Olleya sp. HaHaR_3_96 TaxID=2745560 RepID=UPI001C4F4CA5|nr:hypothetical protein [Olleya sp. HaHaR_3_96]QXP61562.1 hypothetical protein H0I26_08010 [Olleya sp. HaHaR_3_96]